MSLSCEQHNIGIYVIIVVLEASYRPARCDLFDGGNHCPIQLHAANREKGMSFDMT
jgi:hypothetical protein